jgi:hypothetical protein
MAMLARAKNSNANTTHRLVKIEMTFSLIAAKK